MRLVIAATLLVVASQWAAVVAPKVQLSAQDKSDLSCLTSKLPLEYLAAPTSYTKDWVQKVGEKFVSCIGYVSTKNQ